MGEVSKQLGQMWKDLPSDEKAPFEVPLRLPLNQRHNVSGNVVCCMQGFALLMHAG